MLNYCIAQTEEEYKAAAILFSEYAEWLGIDLCFQNFKQELLTLNSMYAPPHGGIILCKEEDQFIGCVGIRKLTTTIAELKRMYVQPAHQHKGIGRTLLAKALELAKQKKYQAVRLDTLNHMVPAINLYKKNGFYEIAAYYNNPDPRVVYLEAKL